MVKKEEMKCEKPLKEKPIMVYLAFSFTGSSHGLGHPKYNTEKARRLAIEAMKVHPEWYVIVPHYAIDAMLDGTIEWDKKKIWTKERRRRGGIMSLAFLSHCDILLLGCNPEYKVSHGVTWEWIFTNLINTSWRKDNPIQIIHIKGIIGKEKYYEILEGENID